MKKNDNKRFGNPQNRKKKSELPQNLDLSMLYVVGECLNTKLRNSPKLGKLYGIV